MRAFSLLVLLLAACTNSDAARNALEGAGYTDIQLTGYSMFTCGDSDDTCTGFTATGPSGRRVEGAVGCGYVGKGCTIRTN